MSIGKKKKSNFAQLNTIEICAHRPSYHRVIRVVSKWGSHRPCPRPLVPGIHQLTVFEGHHDWTLVGSPEARGIETFSLMVSEASRQDSSRASWASVAQPRGSLGATEVSYCLGGACGGPSSVSRPLREPKGPFGLESASSGGQKVGETMMASESEKAVQHATHFANEGHRHHRRPPQHSFGYQ